MCTGIYDFYIDRMSFIVFTIIPLYTQLKRGCIGFVLEDLLQHYSDVYRNNNNLTRTFIVLLLILNIDKNKVLNTDMKRRVVCLGTILRSYLTTNETKKKVKCKKKSFWRLASGIQSKDFYISLALSPLSCLQQGRQTDPQKPWELSLKTLLSLILRICY